MTAFDHRRPGTPADRWTERIAALPAVDPPGAGQHLLVLAAHPDDETLGAGGAVAVARRNGAAVTVVVASDGEASHPNSPTHTAGQLARRRRAEVTAAVARFAPGAVVLFLGLPDGALTAHPHALEAQVRYLARSATAVLSPWLGDRHPDHEACARAAANVAAQRRIAHWQFPIWAWHWGDPDGDDLPWSRLARVPLDEAARAAKSAALACHVSQHSDLSDRAGDEAVLPAGVLAHFERADEVFLLDRPSPASDPAYFTDLYAASDDPWGLADRFYEQRKRAVLLASLPRARFARAFEPGCATGLLTVALAERCERVVAWDVAEAALAQTRERVAGVADRVEVGSGGIPDLWPVGPFDLVVLSEVGYYCPDLDTLAQRVLATLADDGVVVACHWRHPAADHPHGAAEVHARLGRDLQRVVEHVEDDFLLTVLSRTGRSVAVETGVLG